MIIYSSKKGLFSNDVIHMVKKIMKDKLHETLIKKLYFCDKSSMKILKHSKWHHRKIPTIETFPLKNKSFDFKNLLKHFLLLSLFHLEFSALYFNRKNRYPAYFYFSPLQCIILCQYFDFFLYVEQMNKCMVPPFSPIIIGLIFHTGRTSKPCTNICIWSETCVIKYLLKSTQRSYGQ